MAEDTKVAVRELRQNLSVYLRRVIAGETLTVTERGRAVAALVPLPERASPLRRLVAEGRAAPPRGDLAQITLPDEPVSTRLSEALDAERGER